MHADLPRSRPEPAPATVPAPADSDRSGCALLRMAIGDDAVAVPIAEVREILEVGRLTALPRTPPFVRGVMNLRGAVVPVIDLVARLGHAPAEIGRRSCVVVVEAGPPAQASGDAHDAADEHDNHLGETLVVGLLVDAVYEVFDAPPGDFEPVPPLGTRIDPGYLQGLSRVRGEAIGVLALDRVLAQQALSALIAAHVPH